MSNSVTRKELNVLINLTIVYPKYYAEYIAKAAVRRQEREKTKRENHTHTLKSFQPDIFFLPPFKHEFKLQPLL